jgi:ribosomal peptide maturation radical SAM protein 1
VRILLVNMPWAPIDVPSLALGILANSARERLPGAEVEVIHANIDFVDWAVDRAEFGMNDYYYFSLHTYFSGFGEWVFSSALNDDPRWRLEEFTSTAKERQATEGELAVAVELHRLAPEFVADLAARIVERAPDVVGFTSAFQQNAAALATARDVKRLDPRIRTVIGGSNCDGEQGAAIHRNFPFVDFVVRGEGELVFLQLMAAIDAERAPGGPQGESAAAAAPGASAAAAPGYAAIAGLCWTGTDGPVVNPMSTTPLPPTAIVAPEYTGYVERLAGSRARTWVEPKLLVEGARGCWWGEKHHCTFCGLNGSVMEFRSKHPDRFYQEIIELVERHQVLDMYVVDNILDMGYMTSLLPRLAASGYDLRLQYEIKANMKGAQVKAMADAGVVSVQPGIENLNGRVLKLMDKGVTGCQHARILRDSETHGITIAWNYLYGFPTETEADYEVVLEQLPALAHLGPPSSSSRIALERFSPYFNRPELGFADPRPAAHYRLIYDLPDSELMDLVYVFEVAPRGIGQETVTRLDEAIASWNAAYATSRLTYHDLGHEIVLVSDRPGFAWRVLRLTTPLEVEAFRCLDQPQTSAAMARRLDCPVPQVETLLRHWRDLGVVFADGAQFIQVAPQAMNQSTLKIDQRRDRGDEPAPAADGDRSVDQPAELAVG